MKLMHLFVLFTLTLVGLGACASTPKAQRYDYMLSQSNEPFAVHIHDEVITACELDSARAYFTSASTTLDEADKRVIHEVAQCLSHGKLAGRSVLITGYTDDLGTREANKDLGLERSKAVAFELASHGVPPSHIYLRSSGERLATGDTASGRAYDRKVVLRIVERDI